MRVLRPEEEPVKAVTPGAETKRETTEAVGSSVARCRVASVYLCFAAGAFAGWAPPLFFFFAIAFS
jgi:hypothetical protein